MNQHRMNERDDCRRNTSADLLCNDRSFSVSTAKLFLVLPHYYLFRKDMIIRV